MPRQIRICCWRYFTLDGSYETHPLESEYASIQHTYVEGIKAGQKYGFIVQHGDDLLCLSDPYAKALDKSLTYEVPFKPASSFDLAKCVVIDTQFDWQDTPKPERPREEMVLFETHVKGVTKQNPEVEKGLQGTYLGLISEPMLTFYREQNINTLQLLPIAACMHEPHLLEMGKVNYWGYNPYVFMAPDSRYARHDAVTELKTTIRELHKQGIEVILDVVYNHTAEGGEDGPIFNLKALDPHYYLQHGPHFANFTGCGNTLDLSYQPSLTLVMDTLRYWVSEYHIDGFRFDLAATLGRNGDDFSRDAAFFKAVAQDPILRQVKTDCRALGHRSERLSSGEFPLRLE